MQIQIMFLGNDPERERENLYPPHVKRGGTAGTKQNRTESFSKQPNEVWFCFIWTAPQHAQSCKELIQTDLRCSTVEREQKTTKQKREAIPCSPPGHPSSFFLHSTGEYEHMISHMLHPTHTHTLTFTHIYTCGGTQKHRGVHPGPSQPNFPATPYSSVLPSSTFG